MASSNKQIQDYDLMFITDATASMGLFLTSLKKALPQIFDLVQLTNLVDRVSVLAFRDYCDDTVIEWSEWMGLAEADQLASFVEKLKASGGGDEPEAVKTGLWEASKKVEKPTICIMYVDAPPHHQYKGECAGENYKSEVAALGVENSEWLNICERMRQHKMQIYPVFPKLSNYSYPFFTSLAEITGGQCFQIDTFNIVCTTIGILLSLAGEEFVHHDRCFDVKMNANFNTKNILRNGSGKYSQPPEFWPPKVKVNEDIRAKIGDPIKRFQTCGDYKNLVFNVYERLMLPDKVMAFTYNTMFGKLWREICKQKDDPRRDRLVVELSKSVTAVSDYDRALLQTFLYESYDQTTEIQEIINSHKNVSHFYVIDHDEKVNRKVLFEIGLSCAPFAIQSVLKLLTGLRVASQTPRKASKLTYIPVNMDPSLTFRLLPHLMCSGTMFTYRLSVIMAAIAKIAGSILHDDAIKYLEQSRGKWIDFSLPENNSMDFARLMMKVSVEALTKQETKYFRALLLVGSLKKSKAKPIDVQIPYTSYKTKRPDFKDQCKICKQFRSMTLLIDDTCAFCIESDGKSESFMEPMSDSSWMCECRKCLVHYAVLKVEDLKCNAKCHFCRIGKVSPFVECQTCSNKFLYQRSKPLPKFVCAVCAENKSLAIESLACTIEEYICQNSAAFIGVEIDNSKQFFNDGNKLSKMSVEEILKVTRNMDDISESDLIGHKLIVGQDVAKVVFNVSDLQRQIFEIFTKPDLSDCMICFEEITAQKLKLICGRNKKGCTVKACTKCLNNWYNQLQPGGICQPAQLVCPYCKNVPLLKVVRQYNNELCTLMNKTDVSSFDPSNIYAWCVKCYEIKYAMARECGVEQQITNFKCEDCQITKPCGKMCPKCTVMTMKDGGCNHIHCTNCYSHWCWVCGALSSYEKIYKHLSEIHGGFLSDDENDLSDDND